MSAQHVTSDLLTIERVFAAPRELVYRAFTDPDQFALWFGPQGFSTPRQDVSIDPRAGGHLNYVMVTDDRSFASGVQVELTEVIEHELLVGTQTWEGIPGIQDGGSISLRAEFHTAGSGTRLVLVQGPFVERAEDLARRGWEGSFTKLDALLAG